MIIVNGIEIAGAVRVVFNGTCDVVSRVDGGVMLSVVSSATNLGLLLDAHPDKLDIVVVGEALVE